MPKTKIRTTLLINYDEAKDVISITADRATTPDLAADGLYITLKPGTPSETLLRRHLINAGIIQRDTPALTFDQLVTMGAISKSNATLLQLLANDRRGILIQGMSKNKALLAASYLAAYPQPRVIVVDAEPSLPGRKALTPLMNSEVVYLDTTGKNENPDVNYDWLVQQAYRMRPDFIVQDLQHGLLSLATIPKPPAGIGMVWLDDRLGLGITHDPKKPLEVDGDLLARAEPGLANVNCSAIIHVSDHADADASPFAVTTIELR